MTHRVSRGLFGVSRAGQQRLKPAGATVVANSAFAVLSAVPPNVYALKERRDLLNRLVRGEPDIHGRRLFDEEARTAAKSLVRYINQRLRFVEAESNRYVVNLTEKDVTTQQIAHAYESLRRVYAALEAGRP